MVIKGIIFTVFFVVVITTVSKFHDFDVFYAHPDAGLNVVRSFRCFCLLVGLSN